MEENERRSVGIVEDEGMIAMLLRELLTREGFEVVCTVKTGREAVDCVRDRSPQVMLMDINLKEDMDGIEAATRIREFSDIPIIFLTAYTDSRTKERAEGVRPYAFLPKPINKKLLLTALTQGIPV
ncbi:response regulator [Methanogenium sp. S4BF]|uniref:response regulator n=1 Tax=Methanogenium sp. S4BF TaxID=1789226 RepID=UPI00241609D9|nr:response regulator [Methanogenium sp. S4BF]WFN34179.1 response regulator [Methanogenium sp. S4BF]